MKPHYVIRLFYLIFTVSFSQSFNDPDNIKPTLPKIAILGTFHFGSTSDVGAVVMEEVNGERRQQEIQQLVEKLRAFQPTKVLVEFPLTIQDTLQRRFEKFQNQEFELPLNETYQVGFRLADQSGHDSIYAIDHKMDLPFDSLVKYCEEHNSQEKFQAIMAIVQSYTQEETEVLRGMELSTFLKRMNTRDSDRFGNGLYLREVLAIGDPENEVGAAVNAIWYQRNMIILKNISQHLQNPEDRVLVIVGASHRALLMDFLQNRPEYEIVEILNYLD